jgi:hypothetical protein
MSALRSAGCLEMGDLRRPCAVVIGQDVAPCRDGTSIPTRAIRCAWFFRSRAVIFLLSVQLQASAERSSPPRRVHDASCTIPTNRRAIVD